MRHFLFLQGPHGKFFKKLGLTLVNHGCTVSRINLCGGDWYDWHGKYTSCYRKNRDLWGSFIADYYQKHQVTDVLVFGDWRPMHSEAITIAKIKNIRVWVFEEGYLRPAYVTMEKNGVNGRSELFKGCDDILGYRKKMDISSIHNEEPLLITNSLKRRMSLAFNYSAVELLAKPFFWSYKTHRPNGIMKELGTWILRILDKKVNRKKTVTNLKKIYRTRKKFFLFPLQLDSDSQVRLYSPFNGMKEAIICIVTSFAQYASKDDILVIRNHPMDNGLINYRKFIESFSKALNVQDRVFFVETGNSKLMFKNTKAMIVLNSTIGMTALKNCIPVYCLGTSIYVNKGLAQNKDQMDLNMFWKKNIMPKQKVVRAFETILKSTVLINGNFYSDEGVELIIPLCVKRLLVCDD